MSSSGSTIDKVTRLSPSRIKDFEQCPKLFHFKAMGFSTPPTTATAKGTLAHYVFERIFDHPRSERVVETALGYLRPAWEMMVDPFRARTGTETQYETALRDSEKAWEEFASEPSAERRRRDAALYRAIIPVGAEEETFLDETEQAVRNWFKMENPAKFDPQEREFYVAAKIAGIDLHGYIDRLDRVSSPNGDVRYYVSDYKTGRPPSERFADDAFFQLQVYAVLVDKVLGVRTHQLRLVYVREGRPDAVLTRMVTPSLLKQTTARISAVVKQIEAAKTTGVWPAKRQTLCGWCTFQNACPAFDESAVNLSIEEIAERTGTTPPQS